MSLHPLPTTEFRKTSSQLELIHNSTLIHSYLHTYWSGQLVTRSSWSAAYAQTHSHDFWEETGDKGGRVQEWHTDNHCWLCNAEHCTRWPWGPMSLAEDQQRKPAHVCTLNYSATSADNLLQTNVHSFNVTIRTWYTRQMHLHWVVLKYVQLHKYTKRPHDTHPSLQLYSHTNSLVRQQNRLLKCRHKNPRL